MTLPRQFYRVEWEMARHYRAPHDRVRRSRNFVFATMAAAQVRAISLWVPSHAELVGVYRTTEIVRWEQLDPETGLPPLLPHDEDRYSTLASLTIESQEEQ
jgi:hypothetical protein